MKKLIILFLALAIFVPLSAFASDFSVTGKGGMFFPTDTQFQQGNNFQLNINWKSLYVFGSYTMTERRIAGQRAGAFDILGIGLGLSVPIHKFISLWGQAGYYIPNSELEGSTAGNNWDDWSNYRETHYLYWNKWGQEHNYNTKPYTIYEYKVSGNVGGAVGLDLTYPIFKNTTVGLNVGYQLLRLREQFYARYAPSPQTSWIETRQQANLSGAVLGLELTYRF